MKLFRSLKKRNKKNIETVKGGSVLIMVSILANILNLLFAIYTGRVLSLENFAVIGLLASIENLTEIPFSSYSRTVAHKTAHDYGRFKKIPLHSWGILTRRVIKPSIIVALVWVLLIPILSKGFTHVTPLALFSITAYWGLGLLMAVNSGFISGSHKFKILGISILTEVFSKLLFTVLFVLVGLSDFAYLAFPVSIFARYIFELAAIKAITSKSVDQKKESLVKVPAKFLLTSVLSKITSIVFLSGDVILANYYLPPNEAGRYTILSTAGKLIYFLGSLSNQFVNPIVSRFEGARENSARVFLFLIGITALFSGGGYVIFGLFGRYTVPFILGGKSHSILEFLPFYGLGMLGASIGSGIISYNQVKKKYSIVFASFVISLLILLALVVSHASVASFNRVMFVGGISYLLTSIVLHKFGPFLSVIIKNNFPLYIRKEDAVGEGERKILILNWRDTKHSWAGGAEVYAHEIAKRLVAEGNAVTLFCGNDGNSKNIEIIDGVHVIRKGGFYTVYTWAFLYYIFSFRGKFDCIMDTENGVPFFTPLYARIPIFLVIHHIHQDVHQQYMRFPLSYIAKFIEGKCMPFVYKKTKVITISNSSLQQIARLMPQRKEDIIMMHPGIDQNLYKKSEKTRYPSFVYLGRLKHYKNIDIAIKAFDRILKKYPNAKLWIAGEGDEDRNLEKLVHDLRIKKSVRFFGKVNERKKSELLGSAWVALQPSMVEGWGITVIEANAAGTPVIASRVNGLVDSIQDGKTGMLVTPRNIGEFSRGMEYLLKNEKIRKNMTKNAILWSEGFTWDETTRIFINSLKASEKVFSKRLLFGEGI